MKNMKQVVLGTAGHIDHGKTSLVKALTGVDTDRLKEEKERGITIELGFAPLELPSGIHLGIVDVPGHERFVKQMVAGVWGIDLVALVIAADESVMPQTREHLDICKLLKVKKGLIVLTKIDLVDRELLELVTEEVSEVVQNTFLQGAPIVPVSTVTGEGIPLLITELDLLAAQVVERPSDGLFRLPIDRIFVMKGFGTVVTGTMVSGSISLGEIVQILPSGLEGKVRNLQVHNKSVEKAVAGQRTAVNLQGIETAALERGEVLVRPHTLIPTTILDASLEYLPGASRPLKHRTTLRFHVGTALTMASVFLLDREELAPGDTGFAQIRVSPPVLVLPQDRFVIRGSAAIQTLGGGVILDAHPAKHKRNSPSVLQELKVLRDGSGDETIMQHIRNAGMGGTSLEDLSRRVAMAPKEIRDVFSKMAEKGDLVLIDPDKWKVIDRKDYQTLRQTVMSQLSDFHQRFPMKTGLSKEELRTKLPAEVDVRLYQNLLNSVIETGEILLEKDKLKLRGHQISTVDEKGLMKKVEETILKGGLQPLSPKELAEAWSEKEDSVQAIFEHLVQQGLFIKIRAGMYFHHEPFQRLKERLVSYLKQNREITTSQFKEITAVSRKYSIPLIEYFDQMKLTLRVGEKRVLRSSSQESGKSGP